MPGAFGSRRGAALYLLAWLLLGLLLAALLAAGGEGWVASLVFTLPLSLLYAFVTGFSSYYLCRARPLAHNGLASILGVFGVGAAVAAALWTLAAAGWSSLWRALSPGWSLARFSESMELAIFGLGVILYGLSAVVHYLTIEMDRARQLEMRELQTRLAAQEAELRMLRTQVDPHFLFNSLNSISALTASDPAAARAMVLELAAFFRHSLGLEAHRKVALADELRLLRHFLAVEQVRFGERLVFEQSVASDALPCLLPPMLLQPLVENAVKHGIADMLEAGTIRLAATRVGSLLRISIENDVDPDTPAARHGNGIGLANVRQRLAAAYPRDAGVSWGRHGMLFRVDIVLPVETAEG